MVGEEDHRQERRSRQPSREAVLTDAAKLAMKYASAAEIHNAVEHHAQIRGTELEARESCERQYEVRKNKDARHQVPQ